MLADAHPLLLEAFKRPLEPEIEVTGILADGRGAVGAAEKLRPGVVVPDISMPVLKGIEAVRQIVKSGSRAKVIFLTVHKDPDMLPLCFNAGVHGFVVKSRLAPDLIPAISLAVSNHTFAPPTLTWANRV